MKQFKNTRFPLILFSSLSIALLIAGCGQSQPEQTAETPQLPISTLALTTADTHKTYPATLQGATDLEIRPQLQGIIEKIYVSEGEHVVKGQPLFKINDQAYHQTLNSSKAELLEAAAALQVARIELERIRPLVENKVVAESQLKTASAAYQMALAREKRAQASVSGASVTLGYTLIKAPIEGEMGRIPVKAGSLVSPQDPQPLTRLSGNSRMFAYFSISEREFDELSQVLPGASLQEKLRHSPPIELLLPAGESYPQKGTLEMAESAFDPTTGSITLRASFPNQQGLLRSGNSAKVKISFTHAGVIRIAQASTIEIQDKVFVFTLDKGNHLHRSPINILGSSGSDYLIKDGLRGGERILAQGLESATEGMLISPQDQK